MKTESLFNALEKVFHEPNRMAIVSALCGSENGLTFPELKNACHLTDGNLSRHVKVLFESKMVRIQKAFIRQKPCTRILLSPQGLLRFQEYLETLASVLEKARASLPEIEERGTLSLQNAGVLASAT